MVKAEQKIEKINKKNKLKSFIVKRFVWVIMFAVLLILLLGYFILLRPKYNQVYTKLDEIELKKEKYKRFFNNFEETKALLLAYRKLEQEDLDKVRKVIPVKDLPEILITEIDNLISKNGLLMTSISLSPAEEAESKSNKVDNSTQSTLPSEIDKIKVSVNVIGVDYNSFKNLILAFENNLRLFDIDNVSFSSDKETCILDFYTYYFKE